ncbi:hypothetical protein REH65_26760 [Saccharopolyspora sp. ID03-671]|uniref:hypothetical protein n=1 Tax=Saccharopolyspora sp. ID03-671 TaxID=3073066 RepID=UPI00324508C3
MSNPDQDPMLDIARGDRARSQHLRDSLQLLRGKVDNPEFRRIVDDVLAGKASLREVAQTAAFGQAVAPLAQQAVDRMKEMTEDERTALADEGERQFDELRRNLAERAESGMPAKRETSPRVEEEDEDLSQVSFLEDPASRDR